MSTFKYSAKNEIPICIPVPNGCDYRFPHKPSSTGFIRLLLFAALIAKPLLHKEYDVRRAFA